jgi:hypothetical protein
MNTDATRTQLMGAMERVAIHMTFRPWETNHD